VQSQVEKIYLLLRGKEILERVICMKKKEILKSGAPIITHSGGPKQFDGVAPSVDSDSISDHVTKHIGPIASVFHEIVSRGVHLDVNWIAPTPSRPIHVLVTMGMSDLPMNVPKELKDDAYMELLVVLPGNWPLTKDALKDEQNYWPIRLLKDMARLPHDYNTWLGFGHTVPNGDPPVPYSSNTSFCCALIHPPILLFGNPDPVPFPLDFFKLRIDASKTIRFFTVLPMYAEEVAFKLDNGLDPLMDLYDQHNVTSMIDIHRPNVCAGK